jgi:hypothetical protein
MSGNHFLLSDGYPLSTTYCISNIYEKYKDEYYFVKQKAYFLGKQETAPCFRKNISKKTAETAEQIN